LRAGYKTLGYRLHGTEALMVHRLNDIPKHETAAIIQRVTDQSLSEKWGKATRSRPLPEKFFAADSLLPAIRRDPRR